MIPCMGSKTGWKYIGKNEMQNIIKQKLSISNNPPLRSERKPKLDSGSE
jgi:hypothetical protein